MRRLQEVFGKTTRLSQACRAFQPVGAQSVLLRRASHGQTFLYVDLRAKKVSTHKLTSKTSEWIMKFIDKTHSDQETVFTIKSKSCNMYLHVPDASSEKPSLTSTGPARDRVVRIGYA